MTESNSSSNRARFLWAFIETVHPANVDSSLQTYATDGGHISFRTERCGKRYYRCSLYNRFGCKFELRTHREVESGCVILEGRSGVFHTHVAEQHQRGLPH